MCNCSDTGEKQPMKWAMRLRVELYLFDKVKVVILSEIFVCSLNQFNVLATNFEPSC